MKCSTHIAYVFEFSFSMLPPLLCSTFTTHLIGLSGDEDRVELGCAPHWEGRGWKETQSTNHPVQMSKCCPRREDNKVQAWSTPQHLPSRPCPFLVLYSGKEPVFARLAIPSKQLVISACADRHGQLVEPHKLLVLLLFNCQSLEWTSKQLCSLASSPRKEPSDPFTHHRSQMGYLANKSGQSERV